MSGLLESLDTARQIADDCTVVQFAEALRAPVSTATATSVGLGTATAASALSLARNLSAELEVTSHAAVGLESSDGADALVDVLSDVLSSRLFDEPERRRRRLQDEEDEGAGGDAVLDDLVASVDDVAKSLTATSVENEAPTTIEASSLMISAAVFSATTPSGAGSSQDAVRSSTTLGARSLARPPSLSPRATSDVGPSRPKECVSSDVKGRVTSEVVRESRPRLSLIHI